MIEQPRNARQNLKDRQRKNRLQRSPSGAPRLPSARGPGMAPSDPDFLYKPRSDQGIEVRKNRRNRFCVVRWHYSADPEKRDPQYAIDGRAGNPAWDQEMEIDFKSKRGIKVFPQFPWARADCDLGPFWSSLSNVILPAWKPPEWWAQYVATDPGRNRCWASLVVLVDEFGIWHVFRSIVRPGMGYREAKRRVAALLGSRPVQDHVIDPASKQRRTESLKTLIEKMAERPYEMNCIPVEHLGSEYMELEELTARMSRRPDGRFGVYFWDTPPNQECINQFRNAVYADDYGERLTKIDVDAVDALKYLATYMLGRAVKPRKPPEAMSPDEYRAHLTTIRRQSLYREAGRQQQIREGRLEAY